MGRRSSVNDARRVLRPLIPVVAVHLLPMTDALLSAAQSRRTIRNIRSPLFLESVGAG